MAVELERRLAESLAALRGPAPSGVAEDLAQIAAALQAHGHFALGDICLLLGEALPATDAARHPEIADLFDAWYAPVRRYLSGDRDPECIDGLVAPLAAGCWPQPLDAEDLSVLRETLRAGQSGAAPSEDGAAEPAPAPADPAEPPGPLPEAVQELIDLLRQEVDSVVAMLAAPTAEGRGTLTAPDREHLAEELGRFGEASEAAGFAGLRQVLNFAGANLGLVDDEAADTAASAATQRLLAGIADYLQTPGAAAASEALGALLNDPGWPQPLDAASQAQLVALLSRPVLEVDEALLAPARPTLAEPEQVSLALPEDVEPELLDSLLQELPGQTAEFSRRVQQFAQGGGADDVEAARRIAHTIKGAANTVGVVGIANLTHQLEDVLDVYSKHQRLPGPAAVEVLLTAADCLEAMSEALTGEAPAPEEARAVLQTVLDWANRIDAEGLPADDDRLAPAPAPEGETAPPVPAEVAEEDETPEAKPVLRVEGQRIDDLLTLMGEAVILTGQVHERLRGGVQHARSMRDLFSQVQQLGYELEQLVDVKDLSGPRLRAVGEDFDPLELDEYNEFHTISRRLVEAATDAREMLSGLETRLAGLESLLVDQGRLNRESHEAVLATRMVPVKNVVPRLQRVVRQAARVTGKQVELQVSGEHTLMDNSVLTELVDPLMHLLRNAVDHGLEPAPARAATGKPEVGHIELGFAREGNQVLVSCRDDGAGLDLAAVRVAAEARGWLAADAPASDEELRRLVFRPGLSTRERATQVSGRGVGMDVVHAAVTALGGFTDIQSEPGQGCTVLMRLPLSMISTHAVLVRVRNQVLAIANRGLRQILYAGDGELREEPDGLVYETEGASFPAQPIERLLGARADHRSAERAPRTGLLVQGDSGPQVVLVQGVIDSRDVVIKSMGRYVPRLKGVAGATILGDGTVTPVIDLPELLRLPLGPITAETAAEPEAEPVEAQLPQALIVDDSLSARRSMRRVMEDFGFRVRTARDGLEAVDILANYRPDIMLVDLEMPRMNGLELTAHVRAQQATAKIPVVMVTSRATHKHRQQAQAAGVDAYFTKPVVEDELVDAVGRLYAGG